MHTTRTCTQLVLLLCNWQLTQWLITLTHDQPGIKELTTESTCILIILLDVMWSRKYMCVMILEFISCVTKPYPHIWLKSGNIDQQFKVHQMQFTITWFGCMSHIKIAIYNVNLWSIIVQLYLWHTWNSFNDRRMRTKVMHIWLRILTFNLCWACAKISSCVQGMSICRRSRAVR